MKTTTHKLQKKLFAGDFVIEVESSKKNTNEILQDAYAEGLRLEKIFNIYDETSFISKLHTSRKETAPPEFIDVLKKALEMCEYTRGRYDITLGRNFIRRKKHRQLEPLACSYRDVIVTDKHVELGNEDVLLDFGSIAKGYITDTVVEFLQKRGLEEGSIHARGDIRVWGAKEQGVSIQHPRKDDTSQNITIKNKAIATSGDYRQFDTTPENSHILHNNELISVTVLASDLATADLYATVLSVLSKKEREIFLQENKDVQVLTISNTLQVRAYNNFPLPRDGDHIENFFSKEDVGGQEQEGEEESTDWFIGDGPIDENAREVFLKPVSRDDEDADLLTSAS